MRYSLPQAATANQPAQVQQIVTYGNKPLQVIIQNLGGSPVWFSENLQSLSAIDGAGNPTDGFILLPGTAPVVIDTVNTNLYAVSPGGSLVNCTAWYKC